MADYKKIILITGANTGLGYEIIRALAGSNKSYDIFLGGRTVEKAQSAAELARVEFPHSQSTIHPVQIDIEDDQSIDTLLYEIEGKHGKIDILVNNAGTVLP